MLRNYATRKSMPLLLLSQWFLLQEKYKIQSLLKKNLVFTLNHVISRMGSNFEKKMGTDLAVGQVLSIIWALGL